MFASVRTTPSAKIVWLTLRACLCAVVLWTILTPARVRADEGIEFFEKKIRPALVDHCYKCHSVEAGEGKAKGGLLVDSRAGLRTGGETGPAVVPGSPEDSLLLDALKHDGLEMPPGKKLADEDIATLKLWIERGIPFVDIARSSMPGRAAIRPTSCLSIPRTVTCVGAGTSNSMPGRGVILTGWE